MKVSMSANIKLTCQLSFCELSYCELSYCELSFCELSAIRTRPVKTPPEKRICQLCHDGVEDELHFLLNCKFHMDGRQKFSVPNDPVGLQLVFQENASQTEVEKLGKFIVEAMDKRQKSLGL